MRKLVNYERQKARGLAEWEAKCRAYGVDPETTLSLELGSMTPERRAPQPWQPVTEEALACPDCVVRLTTMPGYPVRLFPCEKHGTPVCEEEVPKYGPPSGWLPSKELPPLNPEGDHYVFVAQRSPHYPKDRGWYHTILPVSMATAVMAFKCFTRNSQNFEEPDVLNPAREAHNNQIRTAGRCTIPGCPHTREWARRPTPTQAEGK